MRLAACVLAAAALLLTGCRDSADSTATGGDTLSVYSLLPLEGPDARISEDLVDGQKLALRDQGGLVDRFTLNFRSVNTAEDGRVTPGAAAGAARQAAQDPSAIAAIGALSAPEAETDIPLLNEASVALVTPAVTDLAIAEPRLYPTGRSTLARVVGDDRSQARAIARLAGRLGCGRLRIQTGASQGERILARLVARAQRPAGAGRRCTFLAIYDASAAARAARAAGPGTIIAPAALATPEFARAVQGSVQMVVPLPAAGPAVARAFARTFRRPASREALLGYDAMRAVLTAVRQNGQRGNDRAHVAGALAEQHVDRWATAVLRRGEIRVAPS